MHCRGFFLTGLLVMVAACSSSPRDNTNTNSNSNNNNNNNGAVCGDGQCTTGETQANCCNDCGCPTGKTCNHTTHVCGTSSGGAVCGNGTCDLGETQDNCCEDCGCPGGTCNTTTHACSSGGGGTVAPGGACTNDSQCAGSDATCRTDLPGGYCLQNGCAPEGSTDSAGGITCPQGSICIQISETDYSCGAGPCQTDTDCARHGEGYICDFDGSCWSYVYVPQNPGGAAMGAACTDDSECESGLCANEGDYGMPGGYCTTGCNPDQATSCPTGTACVAVDAFGGYTTCMAKCTQATDCRSGYDCASDGTCELHQEPPPPATPPTGKPGSSCTQDSNCTGTGAVCDTTLLNGYCFLPCTTDADCGTGAFCLDLSNGKMCVEGKCSQDSDCTRNGEGYICDVDGSCWYYGN